MQEPSRCMRESIKCQSRGQRLKSVSRPVQNMQSGTDCLARFYECQIFLTPGLIQRQYASLEIASFAIFCKTPVCIQNFPKECRTYPCAYTRGNSVHGALRSFDLNIGHVYFLLRKLERAPQDNMFLYPTCNVLYLIEYIRPNTVWSCFAKSLHTVSTIPCNSTTHEKSH